jgi:hydrogenase maturation protease
VKNILVAGIGNIFEGDDAFGVEVVQRLCRQALPEGVTVRDFGIRGLDLAYALMEGHDAVVLVDAAPHGAAAGTVSVIELEPVAAGGPVSAHSVDPASALGLVRSMGGEIPPAFLVACEPETLGGEDGVMGLSAPVAAAIDPAIGAIERLVRQLQGRTS